MPSVHKAATGACPLDLSFCANLNDDIKIKDVNALISWNTRNCSPYPRCYPSSGHSGTTIVWWFGIQRQSEADCNASCTCSWYRTCSDAFLGRSQNTRRKSEEESGQLRVASQKFSQETAKEATSPRRTCEKKQMQSSTSAFERRRPEAERGELPGPFRPADLEPDAELLAPRSPQVLQPQ